MKHQISKVHCILGLQFQITNLRMLTKRKQECLCMWLYTMICYVLLSRLLYDNLRASQLNSTVSNILHWLNNRPNPRRLLPPLLLESERYTRLLEQLVSFSQEELHQPGRQGLLPSAQRHVIYHSKTNLFLPVNTSFVCLYGKKLLPSKSDSVCLSCRRIIKRAYNSFLLRITELSKIRALNTQ